MSPPKKKTSQAKPEKDLRKIRCDLKSGGPTNPNREKPQQHDDAPPTNKHLKKLILSCVVILTHGVIRADGESISVLLHSTGRPKINGDNTGPSTHNP